MPSLYSRKAQWFEHFLNSTYIGIVVVSKDRKILYANQGFCNMAGYTQDELVGHSTQKVYPSSHAYTKFAVISNEMSKKGVAVKIDYQLRRKDGSLFWVSISGDISAHDREETLWTVVDISNEKIYQEKLQPLQELEKIKERFELAMEGYKAGNWEWDLRDNSAFYSSQWLHMLGYDNLEEVPNHVDFWKSLTHPDELDDIIEYVGQSLAQKARYVETQHRLKNNNGEWLWILGRALIEYDENDKPVRMVGIHANITDQKNLQLKTAQQAQIIEQIHDSVVLLDKNGYIQSWNHGAEVLFGYSKAEVFNQHISIITPEYNESIFHRLLKILEKKIEYQFITQARSKTKQVIDIDLSLSLLKDEQGNPVSIIGYSQDITQKLKAQKQLIEQKEKYNYQAHHDSLTHLPNRLLFNDRLSQSLKVAERDNNKVALLFIDLDHFKEINDSLGHEIGDKLLKAVAKRFINVLRKEDTLARLGGDEFTVIMVELNNSQDAQVLTNKIIQILKKPFSIEQHSLYVTASIGISLYPDDGLTPQDLLRFADAAMYRAKKEGRNNFQYYSAEMSEQAFERVTMETALREALNENQFVIHYQPQIDMQSDSITAMEALIRWEHPQLGLLHPSRFVPLAESVGLIVDIDRHVMNLAMQQYVLWYQQGLNPGVLSLNLTVTQLQKNDFLDFLINTMERIGFKSSWLEFEITESQIMEKPQKSIEILNTVNHMGISIAIDDFGTGYSSLSYLKKLPIKKVKIDRSFIKDLPEDEEDQAIVKAIIALAKSLNLTLVAEGVERYAQKKFLCNNRCDLIQGFYYSSAMSKEKIERLLKQHQH